MDETLDRARFLRLAGGVAFGLAGWRVVDAAAAGDPRLRALARVVDGPVIGRAAASYDALRVPYDTRFDGVQPLGIVQPLGPGDVSRTILWARRNHVRLAARSGGHSYGGYSTTTGVVVDLDRLRRIAVNPRARTVTVGAGARLVDIDAALAAHGLAIPAGSCPTVGIGGLALGGGVGFASRAFGTTSDNVLSLQVVTADGRVRTCSPRANADLYWACRGGGGGNFGIATSFTLRAHPVGPVSYYFAAWPWDEASGAVQAWQGFAPHAPDGLFSLCTLQTGQGGPLVRSFGQFLGSESELKRLLKPLAAAQITTGSAPYLPTQLRWAGCLGRTVAECHLAGQTPEGILHRSTFAAKSDYANASLSPAALRTIEHWIETAQNGSAGSGAILLDSYGGALNRPKPGATAFVHRNALFSAQYLTYWNGAGTAAQEWLRGFHAAMRPYVSGFAYQNYIDPELAGWEHAYYGANYGRLRQVKHAVDPDGFFRFRQGIH